MAILTQLGRVGLHRGFIDIVPTITAGAYVVGDALGGLLTFTNASHGNNLSGSVEAVRIVDRAQQLVALDLVLFDQTFTNTADNAAFDPTDADMENHVGTINLPAASYFDFNDNAAVYVVPSPAVPFVTVGTPNLFGQLVVRSGPPTYAATSDIRVRLYVQRD